MRDDALFVEPVPVMRDGCMLTPLIKHHDPDALAGRPLPFNIFNSTGVVLAHQGQRVNTQRLRIAHIFVEEKRKASNFSTEGSIFIEDGDEVSSENYHEETAEKIVSRISGLGFNPTQKTRTLVSSHVSRTKRQFQTKIVNQVARLDTADNAESSRFIAGTLDDLLDAPEESGDYMDTVLALRTKDNYLTFAHSCAVAFYTLAIAKKLKMLKEDFMLSRNLGVGRWMSVKTRNHPDERGVYPFSSQLLKYIDLQKFNITVKYRAADRYLLIERLHDIMYAYTKIDYSRPYDCCNIDFSRRNLEELTMAALNHDIGKICIPGRILNKPGALTDEEFAVMKNHPSLGVSKLKEVGVNMPRMFAYVLSHHMLKPDKGYPLTSHQPPPESKMIAIADIYDALRSPRQYKAPRSQQETLTMLHELYEEGCFEYPLFVAALHTFEEFNHDSIKNRYREVEGSGKGTRQEVN